MLAPPSDVDFTTYSHVSWQMLPVKGWAPAGLLVLFLSLGGLLVSRRSRAGRLCAVWIGFAFLLLGIVGWGTIDNGLSLYSLYFGWAFIAMIFAFINRLPDRIRPLKLGILAGIILVICIYNVYSMRELMIFASQYFPALG